VEDEGKIKKRIDPKASSQLCEKLFERDENVFELNSQV